MLDNNLVYRHNDSKPSVTLVYTNPTKKNSECCLEPWYSCVKTGWTAVGLSLLLLPSKATRHTLLISYTHTFQH